MAGEKPDAFAEQQAALNAPPPKKWVPSARAFGYAILLFLLFGVACGQLGIWSYFLQKLGNIRRVEDYPNRETMQTGNMLFATSLMCVSAQAFQAFQPARRADLLKPLRSTILVALGAPFSPLLFLAFLFFVVAVMNIVGAGASSPPAHGRLERGGAALSFASRTRLHSLGAP
ncbi:hypothetical protein DMC30DRAFT_386900 [Rhodotorula diobovata]|uniref:Uncharacterized protein n=1 Tax=Rhodotorula diobovata TaxID=5288 RepID=A0A5C5G6M1_9BASI|nr:hypothetical protein DMC30DRAFT_386900 [Rhodotorula diobovata]